MDEILIEESGNIEHFVNYSDNLDNIRTDPSGNEDNSQIIQEEGQTDSYVYTSVPEEVEPFNETENVIVDSATEGSGSDNHETNKNEEEEEEEIKEDAKEVQYVYIKSDSVLSDNDINDNNSVETVSVNAVQYLIDTPLNEYKLTDSLLLIIILMGLSFGLVLVIRRSLFKWI